MSQVSDVSLANQGFSAFRTELNNILGALNTCHIGSSAPSSVAAGTIWVDTSGGATAYILKFYDGSDHIALGTINTTANTVDWTDSSVETVSFKQEGTNFTDSLLVGHATTGTLSSAERNTGVGIEALDALTTGDGNTALGYQAGSAITTETSNTLIGKGAGDALASSYNTIIGHNALGAASSSSAGNTAIGRSAMKDSTSATYNTAVGLSALEDTTGTLNIGIGSNAGDNITSGSGNVIIGNVDAGSATGDRQLKITGYDGSTATNWITGDSSGVVTLNAANVTQQAITSSSNAVAWDASAKPNAYHITTENTTFSAPSNAVEGAFICVEINYNGSHTIAWNTVFEFAASTEPTETATDGKTDIHVFRYNGAIWQEVGRTMNLSES